MVWLRAKLLQILARPVLIPITVGGFGLWYGIYNITYQSTSFISNTLLFSNKNKQILKQSTRYIATGCSLTTGILTWYLLKLKYPNDWNSPITTFQYKGPKDIIPLIKNSFTSIKHYPIQRLYTLVLLSSASSGFSKTIFERLFQLELE